MIAIAEQVLPIGADEQPDLAAPGAHRLPPADVVAILDPVRAKADEEALAQIVSALAAEDPRRQQLAGTAAAAGAVQVKTAATGPSPATTGGAPCPVDPGAPNPTRETLAAPQPIRPTAGYSGLSPQAEDFLTAELAATAVTSTDPAHPALAPAAVGRRSKAMIHELLQGSGAQAILAAQVLQLQAGLTRALLSAEVSRDAADRALSAVAATKLAKATAEHLYLLDRLQRPRKRRVRVEKVEVQQGGQAIVGDVHVDAK